MQEQNSEEIVADASEDNAQMQNINEPAKSESIVSEDDIFWTQTLIGG